MLLDWPLETGSTHSSIPISFYPSLLEYLLPLTYQSPYYLFSFPSLFIIPNLISSITTRIYPSWKTSDDSLPVRVYPELGNVGISKLESRWVGRAFRFEFGFKR